MRKRTGKQHIQKAAAALTKFFCSRRFLVALTCLCAAIMFVSAFSIVRSLLVMRALSREVPAAEAEADPYYVPPEEPTPAPETFFFIPQMLTPEPTPESHYGWKERSGSTYYLLPSGNVLTGLHRIDGKLHYFNEYGQHAALLGVDVSYHNKSINWDAVRSDGIDFAIVRLGYRGWETGILHGDTDFEQNLRGAKEAGLKVGVYVYSTAVNAEEAAEEASFVLSELKGFPLDFPVYFDTEQSGEYPNGRADKLSKARRYEIVTSFCRTIEAGGYPVGIYSGQNYLKNHVEISTFHGRPVWLASYTSRNRLPDFPYAYDLWQFTDCAVISGIRGVADLSAIFSYDRAAAKQ